MLEPWRNGKVVNIENETPTTKRFWIEVEGIADFEFKPGQFITLDLPIHEQKNKRWRSYSIASAPNGTNVIELVIVLLEGGAGTTYLFNEIKVGSVLLLRGPQGKFVLPEIIEKELFLICTGTGIAPFRSMVHFISQKNIEHKNIHLIFGCRTLVDGLYINELKALQNKCANFFFHPVYSREIIQTEGMYIGYVHQVYEALTKQKQAASFYLCGWKNMIDDAKEKIIALGYDKKDIHFELYG